MLISCVICSDLLVAADDVSVTPCGHLFHYICLITWMERSKSCPHCRAKTTDKTIHRIFFTVSNQDGVEDNSTLQNKVDSLTFDVRMKNKDLQNAKEQTELFQSQIIGLKSEVKHLEEKISNQSSSLSVFKNQIQHLQTENRNAVKSVAESTRLTTELRKLQSIKTVLNGTLDEVEDLCHNYQVSGDSIKSLCTFVVILKRELKATTDKRKHLRDLLRETEVDMSKVMTERNNLKREVTQLKDVNQHLEEDVKHLEASKKSLQKQVETLEKAILSPSASNPRDRALRRLITESPAPELKRPCLSDPNVDDNLPEDSPQLATLNQNVLPPVTPYLKIKSSSIGLTPLRTKQNSTSSNFHIPVTKNNLSIFKNSRKPMPLKSFGSATSKIDYDGLGGHSKLDDFPRPTSSGNSFKKSKSTSMYKIKNLAPTNTLKLENYFDQA